MFKISHEPSSSNFVLCEQVSHLTTPSGSTSSRCFLPLPCGPMRGEYCQHQPIRGQYCQHQPIRGGITCIPVSTNCPGCWLSRTKKSPSYLSSCSASFLERRNLKKMFYFFCHPAGICLNIFLIMSAVRTRLDTISD